MKLLFKQQRAINHNRVKSYKHLKRNLASQLKKKIKKRKSQNIPQDVVKRINSHKSKYWDYKNISAPEHFSFINNPNEVIGFINRIKKLHDKGNKVFVDLREVKFIDYSAIVVLLSLMVRFASNKIPFNGNFPKDLQCKSKLISSGFFENLGKQFKVQDRYSLAGKNNFHTHAWKNVDPVLSSYIIKDASTTVWGSERRCQGVQRVLLELMQNTNNHADINNKGHKHWWLSVDHDKQNNKVTFCFVDYGVGIFTSLNNKPQNSKFYNWAVKLAKKFKYGNNADLLSLILEGKLHQSVTDAYYRGKGLPGIAEVNERNQISNLIIITNDVCGKITNNEFMMLDDNFIGTFVSWELGVTNDSAEA